VKVSEVRVLLQRVLEASVTSGGELTGRIGRGLCAFVGVTHSDVDLTATKLADKLWNLRVFEDSAGLMNLSVAETSREILVVSQFTLYGDSSKGRRPSFVEAARPEHAEPLIDLFCQRLESHGAELGLGRFRTEMQVHIVNDGPVTLMIEA
jgi:D-tyrosyl-tRNA(Tyr) deacylase|tara:strand:+ start:124 stop:576 length:453 start_codon:yes stop_codon:yes gene_type:complete